MFRIGLRNGRLAARSSSRLRRFSTRTTTTCSRATRSIWNVETKDGKIRTILSVIVVRTSNIQIIWRQLGLAPGHAKTGSGEGECDDLTMPSWTVTSKSTGVP